MAGKRFSAEQIIIKLREAEVRHAWGSQGVGRTLAKGLQPDPASQRLGLSAAGAGGQTT